MKNKIKLIRCISVVTCMCLLQTNVYAQSINQEEKTYELLEQQIESEHIDIIAELDKLTNEYQEILVIETQNKNLTEINKIKDLISGLEKIKKEYMASIQNTTRANQPNTAVAAVIGYFRNKNYKLASELLIHATVNTNKNSTYSPTNGSRVKSHSVFVKIANGSKTNGSDIFTNTGGTASKDCYYALHSFNYSKPTSSSKLVNISDYYDYASGDYNGMEGIAVNAMYLAQQSGAIVPYNVLISQRL